MSDPDYQPPVNPLPPVVAALFLLMAGIELTISLGGWGVIGGDGGVGWRLMALQKYGFSAEIVDWMLRNGVYPVEHLIRFISYGFVNASFTQAVFSCVFLLALGKPVGEVFGGPATLALYLLSGVGGAVVYWLALDAPIPLMGGFPHAYGLIGGFTFLKWLSLGVHGENQMRAFSLIGVLMAIQLVFGMFSTSNAYWVANGAGFVTGFLLSFLLVPGGWGRIRARLRHK